MGLDQTLVGPEWGTDRMRRSKFTEEQIAMALRRLALSVVFASVYALCSKLCLTRLDASPYERPAVSLAILSCDFQGASLSNMIAQL